MAQKLNELALGYAGAGTAAACMLLLTIASSMGLYTTAQVEMQKWHMFYSMSVGGVITGIFEAVVISFIFAYLFAWVYNKFA
jgi:hypothetical protein